MMRRWFTRDRLPIIFLALIAIASHGRMLVRGFVSDDWDWIHIGATARFPEYVLGNYAGAHGIGGSFRPTITFVMQSLYRVFGLHSFWYHALSLALLILTAIGIARLVQSVLRSVRQHEWIAWMSALFFVLIPTHAEAVYWVAGLPDVIAGAAMIWSCVWMIRWVRDTTTRDLVVSILLWIVALGAKENAIVLPGIWFCCISIVASCEWNRALLRAHIRKLVLFFAGAGAVLVAYILWRQWALGSTALNYSVTGAQLTVRNAVVSFLHTGIASVLGWHETRHSIVAWILLHRVGVTLGCVLTGIPLLLVGLRRSARTTGAVCALLLAFVIATMPNVAVIFHPRFAEGERFAYFPSLFVAIAIAWACSEVVRHQPRIGRMVTIFVALSFAVAIPHYTQAWDEADRAFERVTTEVGNVLTPTTPSVTIVGLPEFASQIAPVLRNGLPQWYMLTHGVEASAVGRVPVYTQWDERTAMTWVADTNGWKATYATSTTLWGPAVYADAQYLVELWGYEYAQQHGSNVAKFVFRSTDPRTKAYATGISTPVVAWSENGFIPMPNPTVLK